MHAHRSEVDSMALSTTICALGTLRHMPAKEQLTDFVAGEGRGQEQGCGAGLHQHGLHLTRVRWRGPGEGQILSKPAPSPPTAALEPLLQGAEQALDAAAAIVGLARLGADPGEVFASTCMRVMEADGGAEPRMLANTAWGLAVLQVRRGRAPLPCAACSVSRRACMPLQPAPVALLYMCWAADCLPDCDLFVTVGAALPAGALGDTDGAAAAWAASRPARPRIAKLAWPVAHCLPAGARAPQRGGRPAASGADAAGCGRGSGAAGAAERLPCVFPGAPGGGPGESLLRLLR